MKNIYVFNDSRVTDVAPTFVAITDDGIPLVRIRFTTETASYFAYAMNLVDSCPAIDDDGIRTAVLRTHGDVRQVADTMCGAGQWRTTFLTAPRQHDDFCVALEKARKWQRQYNEKLRAAHQQDAMASVLALLAGTELAQPAPATH